MIEGYIGVPGAGKTLAMTRRAIQTYKMYDEVVSNYEIDIPNCVPLRGPEHFMELGTGALYDDVKRLMLLDEVHLIMDARMWNKIPAEILRMLAQPRKADLDMLYTAQHESQVEKRLRVVTNFLHLCTAWGGAFNFADYGRPFFFRTVCYESFSFERARLNPQRVQNYGSTITPWWRMKKYAQRYDSWQVLERLDLDGLGTRVAQSGAP